MVFFFLLLGTVLPFSLAGRRRRAYSYPSYLIRSNSNVKYFSTYWNQVSEFETTFLKVDSPFYLSDQI